MDIMNNAEEYYDNRKKLHEEANHSEYQVVNLFGEPVDVLEKEKYGLWLSCIDCKQTEPLDDTANTMSTNFEEIKGLPL